MTGRLRMIPWVVGVCLVAGSVAGANKLLHPDAGGGAPAAGNAGGTPTLPGGVVVLGNVDSDPPPVAVGPPAVAAMAAVDKILVAEGQEVKPGDPLVQFDDAVPRAKLAQAQAELDAAGEDVKKAEAQTRIHPIQVERQKNAVAAVAEQLRIAQEGLDVGREQQEEILRLEKNLSTGQPLTDAEKQKRRRENIDLRKGEATVAELKARLDDEKLKQAALALTPVGEDARQAADKVKRLQATAAEAQAAIDQCLVRAKVGGVVEQVAAAPGMTFGPATRGPVLWLIPGGIRVVRAEVEAEFAYKIADKVGKKVTIYDHNNFALVYEGVVRRIGTGYLPKRSAADVLSMTSTRVLECLVEIPDPAPAGKPPLRVGQPVRVSFGQ